MKRWTVALLLVVLGTLLLGAVAGAAPLDERERPGARAPRELREKLRVVSALLEMEPGELLRALHRGESIAALAAEREVELEEIREQLLAPHRERVERLVAEGTLTGEQAAYLTEQAERRVDDFLTLPVRLAFRGRAIADLATVLELPVEEVVRALQAGNRQAEIIAGQSRDVEEVVTEMVALRGATLDEAVGLELMTETQKRIALDHYEERLRVRLTEK